MAMSQGFPRAPGTQPTGTGTGTVEAAPGARRPARGRQGSRLGLRAWASGFIVPAYGFYVLFLIIPLIFTVVLSFTSWDGFDFGQIKFNGVHNYRELAHDQVFKQALVHNLWFLFGSVAVKTLLALALALALYRKFAFSGFFQGVFLVPSVLSLIVVGLVFGFILDPNNGLINPLLKSVGLGSLAGVWFGDPHRALPILMLLDVWVAFGIYMFIFLSWLANLPGDVSEAARIDGARSWQETWYVTLPMLAGTIRMVLAAGRDRQPQGLRHRLRHHQRRAQPRQRGPVHLGVLPGVHQQPGRLRQRDPGGAAAGHLRPVVLLRPPSTPEAPEAPDDVTARSHRPRRRLLPGKLWMYPFLLLLAATIVYPLLWMVSGAFKSNSAILADPFSLPLHPTLANFRALLADGELPVWLQNSALMTVVSVVGILVLAAAAAYGFSTFEFRGKTPLFALLLVGLMVPPQALVIAGYKWITLLHLQDTYGSLIFTYCAWTPFGVLVLRNFFDSVPAELREAAQVDGASHLRIFLQVLLPLARPQIFTIVIFNVIWVWNDFIYPLVYMQDQDKYTVPVGVLQFQGRSSTALGTQMAVLAVATALPLLVYLVFRRQFVRGVIQGAIKG